MIIRSETLNLSFSYRYARMDWSAEKNLEVYGRDASMLGLGGNFLVTASADGEISPADLRPLKEKFDHKCLFEDLEWFHSRPNTLENITLAMAESLLPKPPVRGHWLRLQVQESRYLLAEWDFLAQKLLLKARVQFPMQWRTPSGWGGGEWEAWVAFAGPMDPNSGLMFQRSRLEKQLRETCQIQSREPHFVEGEITPLVNKVGAGFTILQGFVGAEISVNRTQTFQLY